MHIMEYVCAAQKTTCGMSVLSFNYVTSKDQTQVTRLGGKYPHPLSHLAGPMLLFMITYNEVFLLLSH